MGNCTMLETVKISKSEVTEPEIIFRIALIIVVLGKLKQIRQDKDIRLALILRWTTPSLNSDISIDAN